MLNLIEDAWIPVLRAGGADVIRPAEMAAPDIERLNWPRADLNLACLELLVGLVYLAHPPQSGQDRQNPPSQEALQAGLAPLAPAFNLIGDGPLFLQDFEALEGEAKPPDMLFIDSAGESTAKKNADLMVRRNRYQGLPLPLAAMALFTLQAFAPSGGAGNRTSMRGGGPMVTLVRPDEAGLWPLVWANVPHGEALTADELDELPWMRPTQTSEAKGAVCTPAADSGAMPLPEVFFGQPRRLRLVVADGLVTGVIQRPYGINYTGWRHPLSPYYKDKQGQTLPRHPKGSGFGYRHWRGIILSSETGLRPQTLDTYLRDREGASCSLLVAGWDMDNMKPDDFMWSEQPVFALTEAADLQAASWVEAAEQAGFALKVCLRDAVDDNAATTAVAGFFDATQAPFEQLLASLSAGQPVAATTWLAEMRRPALALFDAAVLPGMADLPESNRRARVQARAKLLAAFAGKSALGKKIFDPLNLTPPAKTDKNKRKENG